MTLSFDKSFTQKLLSKETYLSYPQKLSLQVNGLQSKVDSLRINIDSFGDIGFQYMYNKRFRITKYSI